MKLFRFWSRQAAEIQVGDARQTIHCYGGSNQSPEAAAEQARAQIAAIEQRIAGQPSREADYEAAIREEILEELDAHNLVSRNRYGARVLNSENLMFIDIDNAEAGLLDWLFGRASPEKRRAKQLARIEKQAAAPVCAGLSLRIYQTSNGWRLIVQGQPLGPRDAITRKLFRHFHADGLYALLCDKQNCFRARLTPKPSRIRCKGHKVVYPRDDAQQQALEAWLASYEAAAQGCAVCRYVKTLGPELDNPLVAYHDRETRAHSDLKLA